jgi:hypothetical protein
VQATAYDGYFVIDLQIFRSPTNRAPLHAPLKGNELFRGAMFATRNHQPSCMGIMAHFSAILLLPCFMVFGVVFSKFPVKAVNTKTCAEMFFISRPAFCTLIVIYGPPNPNNVYLLEVPSARYAKPFLIPKFIKAAFVRFERIAIAARYLLVCFVFRHEAPFARFTLVALQPIPAYPVPLNIHPRTLRAGYVGDLLLDFPHIFSLKPPTATAAGVFLAVPLFTIQSDLIRRTARTGYS